jgi:hypothetical protein
VNSPAEPGGIVSRAIILNAKLSVHARLLYAVLCCVADDQRMIERSKPELIDDSGLSRATIHRAMAELMEAGIVEVYSSIASDGGSRTNRYRLHEGGLTQRPPWVHTETPGVSEGDPLKESPAQTPVSEGDPPGSLCETGRGVSEGDGGSSLYKKGEGGSSNLSPRVLSTEGSEHIMSQPPEPEPPAPEEVPKVTMLDWNNIKIPVDSTVKGGGLPPRTTTRLRYDYDEFFLAAWEAYGKVGKKQAAWQSWKNANARASIETITAAIPHYLASKGPQSGYTQHFSTWLNNDGWESAEAQPKPKGYQGRAGSDVKSQEGAEERVRRRPICKLMRSGPMPGELDWNRAWYFHWNCAEQQNWTREQMLETGNTPEDVDWLMKAYTDGIDPELYIRLLADINGTDAR